MVQRTYARHVGRATKKPEQETTGALRILWTTQKPQESVEILPGSSAYLEGKPEPPNAGKDGHMGKVQSHRSSAPVAAAAYHAGMAKVGRTLRTQCGNPARWGQ